MGAEIQDEAAFVVPEKAGGLMSPRILPPKGRQALVNWFRRCGRDLPWRRTQDPYAVLVSEFMLQQTRVSVVVDYYNRWMARFPDVASLAMASEQDVLSIWQGLGYYSRARNLHHLAKAIHDGRDGIFPVELDELRKLPGVGDYTAAAVRAFAHNLPAPVVDANVARVLARWANFSSSVDTRDGKNFLTAAASAHQPGGNDAWGPGEWNSSVMELGALLCTSGEPDCLLCPVRKWCRAVQPASLPVKSPRAATTALNERRIFIARQDSIWLQKSTGPRWRGLWILPEWPAGEPCAFKTLCSVVYPITRYKVTMEVVFSKSVPGMLRELVVKHPLETLADLPLAAPHRRAVAQAMEVVHSADDA